MATSVAIEDVTASQVNEPNDWSMVTSATNSQANLCASVSVMRLSIGRSSRSSVAMRATSLSTSSCVARGSCMRAVVSLRARRVEHGRGGGGELEECALFPLVERLRLAERPAGRADDHAVADQGN